MRRMNAVDVVVNDLVEVEFHIWPAAAHRYAVVPFRDQETGTGVEVADHPNRADASSSDRLQARGKVAMVRRAISPPTVPMCKLASNRNPRPERRTTPRRHSDERAPRRGICFSLLRVPHPF